MRRRSRSERYSAGLRRGKRSVKSGSTRVSSDVRILHLVAVLPAQSTVCARFTTVPFRKGLQKLQQEGLVSKSRHQNVKREG